MKNKFLKIEKQENQTVLLTLSRESKLNALNGEVLDELGDFFQNLNPLEIRGVVFTGEGEKAFIAGADIAGMNTMTTHEGLSFSKKGQDVSSLIESCPVPVIAAVNGFALGGGLEMALSCDFIFASENAFLGLPEVSLGLIPGFGGTQRLAKVVGRNRAKSLIYSGRKITAKQAQSFGLVLEVFPTKEKLLQESFYFLGKILSNSSHAISQAKKLINQGADLPVEEGLKLERSIFSDIFSSEDMKEGTSAFIEKRKPKFKGC